MVNVNTSQPHDPSTSQQASSGQASLGIPLLTFIGLALVGASGPLGTDMFLPSIPDITSDLATSPAKTQLALTMFMIGMGLGQIALGPLSDRMGRRNLLIWGTTLGIVASILCSIAPAIEVLLFGRFLQGTAGGIGVVLARAIVSDRSGPAQAQRSFAILMLINAVAPVIAPLIGGVIQEVTGWRWVFWTLTAIALVQMFVALRNPESLPEEHRVTTGLGDTYRNMVRLMRIPAFLGHALIFGFGFGTMFSFISGSSIVLQEQMGLSPLHFSWSFATCASMLIVVALINVRLAGRVAPRKLQKLGITLAVTGASALLLMTLTVLRPANFAEGAAPMWMVVVLLAGPLIAVVGNGFMMANSTALAQGIAARWAGAGSAVLGAMQFSVAALVSPMVALGDNQVFTLACTMCACAVVVLIGNALVVRSSKR